MKLTIESTEKVIELKMGSGAWIPARIWEGTTSTGIPVHCFITRVAVPDNLEPDQYKQFNRELREHSAPSLEVEAIPLRLIL